MTLTRNRIAYLDENGAFNSIFEPGELAQLLDFRPALQTAGDFPGSIEHPQPIAEPRLTPAVLEEFIDVEKPSDTIDGLYVRILVTLGNFGFQNLTPMIRSVMSDGLDHYETFQDMQEWLAHYAPNDYLLNLRQPTATARDHQRLQELLLQVLQTLRRGYTVPLPQGADDIARARDLMLGNGLLNACEILRREGLLMVFDPISSDADFGRWFILRTAAFNYLIVDKHHSRHEAWQLDRLSNS